MMINLDESNLVGKGNHREVYRHPENNCLCIKINVGSTLSAREVREIKREKAYYRRLDKKGVVWDMIPQYHGDIDTNMGVGSIFDLVVDANDSVSQTLGYYLASEDLTKENYEGLVNSLILLRKYLLQNLIIVRGLAHRNMVCQRNASGIYRLSIVDNIGNSEFIPVSNYINFLAKRKVINKWKRFEDRLIGDFPNNKVLPEIIANL